MAELINEKKPLSPIRRERILDIDRGKWSIAEIILEFEIIKWYWSAIMKLIDVATK